MVAGKVNDLDIRDLGTFAQVPADIYITGGIAAARREQMPELQVARVFVLCSHELNSNVGKHVCILLQ